MQLLPSSVPHQPLSLGRWWYVRYAVGDWRGFWLIYIQESVYRRTKGGSILRCGGVVVVVVVCILVWRMEVVEG